MLLDTNSARTFLSEELARRLKANPRYSQRAFARQLGVSPGELSELLRGKRGLSLKSSLRIARALGLNPAETRHLIQLAGMEKGRRSAGAELMKPLERAETPAHQQLTLDMFHVVADWPCFAILNLADCDDFRSETAWIARRLGIPQAEAQLALERLERVGLLERRRGKLVAAKDYVLSPAGIPSEAIRGYHRQLLAKAAESLDHQSLDERDLSGVGFAVDPRHVPAIKREISEFEDQLVAKYSKGRRTEVYQLEVALFRVTQGKRENDHEG